MSERKSVCVYMPLYNEQANLPELFERVEAVTKREPDYDWHYLLVDNASTDRSQEICEEHAKDDPRWRYVRLSRNWEAAASHVAFDYCHEDAMIVLFSDLQDPPELIPEMLRKWDEGYLIVNGKVRARHDSNLVKTVGAFIAYRFIEWLTDARMPRNATDFRLMDRKVVDAMRELREWPRFTRGLIHWIGFKKHFFDYDRAPRKAGVSKGGLIHSINLTIEAILNFSDKPLRMISVFGGVVVVAAMCLAVFYAAGVILGKPAPKGVTTVFVLVLANIGLTSFFLGIIGEYLGRTFIQAKKRPMYFVESTVNVADQRTEPGNP